jgi:hypothetical protein
LTIFFCQYPTFEIKYSALFYDNPVMDDGWRRSAFINMDQWKKTILEMIQRIDRLEPHTAAREPGISETAVRLTRWG